MADNAKDVYTLNELDELHGLVSDVNDFLLPYEDNDHVKILAVGFVLVDANGNKFGSLTKIGNGDGSDLQFEPGYLVEGLA